MGRISHIICGVLCAATAIALPGNLVVLSDLEVRPDEAAGLYYLGSCAGGYLYNGSSAAVGAVSPYRLLDSDAEGKDYYIVWAPEWVGVTPEAFAHLGTAVRLSDTEILVGLERGFGPGGLRAVEHRIELIKLAPVTPVDWKADAEAPPTKKDPRIAAAVNSITAEEYAGYIKRLQDFKTRWTGTLGGDAARDYVRGFFFGQNLTASLFPFPLDCLDDFQYPEEGCIIAAPRDGAPQRSRDFGVTWEKLRVRGVDGVDYSFWPDGNVGFVAGRNGNLAKTVDGGATWQVLRFGTSSAEEYRLTCLYFVDAYVGWIAGVVYRNNEFVGVLFKKTEDGGRTWINQEPIESFYARAISFYDTRRGWVSGSSGVFYTGDGGTTWRQTSLTSAALDLAAVGPKEAWAALGYTGLWHTADGVSWSRADTGFEGYFVTVKFPTASRGYAAGDYFVKSSDGGRTWREIRNGPPLPFVSLTFPDEENGGVESSNRLYLTDDGGASFVDVTDNIDFDGVNVIGERRGCEAADEIVIIGGHFDSTAAYRDLYDAPGADDNASGTACAMAAARAFRNMSFKRTVRYVAFGAEEAGCVGSRYYAEECARRGEKIVAVLNADMVCYDEEGGARDDFAVDYGGFESYEWLFGYVKAVGRFYGNRIIYDEGYVSCDDKRFRDVGYAAIGVIEGEVGPGGCNNYPYGHSSEDTLDKLRPELGVRFVRDYAAMFAHLAGVGDSFLEPTPPAAAVPFSRAFAVYPNPYCYASAEGGVNFVGIKTPATVQIYDLAGRRVASAAVAPQTDELVWRPGGGALSPGVYLYRVQGQEQEESGKIVVVK